ncbi:hypothetical protein Ahy_A03g014292 [Arachis hypogaea]|uniref:Uncharacterized protein n=1 Tax=Arachis hypogaea TaxID=3818 RepID=A0A445DXC3_ARAHY|nr:hypothetical protein Ahy_A03g014292 [Arachis hypogaea]
MHRKLLNVHIPDLAHLAERVRYVELLKNEKEIYENENRLKNRPFTRKQKVAYLAMESSEEEPDLEAEVDLAKLKKGPPYVCSLLKKLPGNEKSNDSKLKSGKRYSFDISKSDQTFYVLLKDKHSICISSCGGWFVGFLGAAKAQRLGRSSEATNSTREGQSSKAPQQNAIAPISHSQTIGVQWIQNCQEF